MPNRQSDWTKCNHKGTVLINGWYRLAYENQNSAYMYMYMYVPTCSPACARLIYFGNVLCVPKM